MPSSNSDPRGGVRMALVLKALAEAEGFIGLSAISSLIGLPPSTVHRLLEQMVETGLARRGEHRSYGVGQEFSRIGALAAAKLDIISLARPAMQRVVYDCNETCMLGVYLPQSLNMAIVAKVDSAYPLKYRPLMNVQRTLAWGASGLAILAWLPKAEADAIIERAPTSPADDRVAADPNQLWERLRDIRARGYSVTFSERTAGAVGIAVPLLDYQQKVYGDLCLTIPDIRYQPEAEANYVRLLKDAAQETSRAQALAGLGHLRAR